jgi:hypothetical protein
MVKGDTAQRKLLSIEAHLAFYDVDEIKVQNKLNHIQYVSYLNFPPVLNLSKRCLVRKWNGLLEIFNYYKIILT